MGRPNGVKNEFASLLRDALRDTRGRVPSAAAIARGFNLRASGAEAVTQESVRRWLRGISMPEERKMAILVSWLNLDLSAAMKRAYAAERNGNGYHNGHADAGLFQTTAPSERVDQEILERAKMIARLPTADQYLVKNFVNRLVQKGGTDAGNPEGR